MELHEQSVRQLGGITELRKSIDPEHQVLRASVDKVYNGRHSGMSNRTLPIVGRRVRSSPKSSMRLPMTYRRLSAKPTAV